VLLLDSLVVSIAICAASYSPVVLIIIAPAIETRLLSTGAVPIPKLPPINTSPAIFAAPRTVNAPEPDVPDVNAVVEVIIKLPSN